MEPKERQANWYRRQKRKRGIIYCIYNKVTGERFIGKSTNSLAKVKHLMTYKSVNGISNSKLSASYKLYGEDSFEYSLIHLVKPTEDVNDVLKHYVKLYKPKLNEKKH